MLQINSESRIWCVYFVLRAMSLFIYIWIGKKLGAAWFIVTHSFSIKYSSLRVRIEQKYSDSEFPSKCIHVVVCMWVSESINVDYNESVVRTPYCMVTKFVDHGWCSILIYYLESSHNNPGWFIIISYLFLFYFLETISWFLYFRSLNCHSVVCMTMTIWFYLVALYQCFRLI